MKYLFLLLISAEVAAEIQVNDYLNRRIVLSQPAERIVALAPHIVENLYSAGAGDKIVGAVDFCDYPEAAKKIPRVGAISAFSLEAIVDLKPDLVIVWRSGRGGKALEKLEQLGITSYASDPRTLVDIPRSIRDYGALTGHGAIAAAAAAGFEAHYNRLLSQHRAAQPISALYQVWNDPIQTINDGHMISDVLRLCGAANAFGDAPSLAPKISIESVIQRDPAAIIASGMAQGRPQWLDEWKKWRNLTAVKFNNLYFVSPDLIQRHTLRILDGAQQMCDHLNHARRNMAAGQR